MAWAIELAKKGKGRVLSNPLVGCVVLSADNLVLGYGHHEKIGGPHAEMNALNGISQDKLKLAKIIVTLEPCSFAGKMPSCAKMLSALPVAEVCYGVLDPNPKDSGEGVKIIEEARKKVIHCSEYQDKCKELAEIFFVNQLKKRPFIAIKVAASLDGKIAHESGESKWITGELAREKSHELRFTYGATLVGRGTLEKDDPSLDIRHPRFKKDNKVIVASSKLSSVKGRKLESCHRAEDIFVVKDIVGELASLYEQGINSILVEGGAGIISSLLSQGLCDKLYCFIAPIVIGSGISWTKGLKIEALEDKIKFNSTKVEQLGSDVLISVALAKV